MDTWKPPSLKDSIGAVGPLPRGNAVLHAAIGDPEQIATFFKTKTPPGPSDWLASTGSKDRPGQSFSKFVDAKKRQPTRQKHVIYLAPLGDFGDTISVPLLVEFVTVWFGGLPVKVLPPLSTAALKKFEHRKNCGELQIKTTPIHAHLDMVKPADAFVVMGFTEIDLYPRDSWNFVYGQADSSKGTGVFSFARYKCEDPALTQRRCFGVLAHEIGHLFGMAHCVWFECMMNGSNHEEESDRRPWRLCPVELRKLYHAMGQMGGLDLLAREKAIAEFCNRVGMEEEATWYLQRVALMESVAPSPALPNVQSPKAATSTGEPQKAPSERQKTPPLRERSPSKSAAQKTSDDAAKPVQRHRTPPLQPSASSASVGPSGVSAVRRKSSGGRLPEVPWRH